MSDDGRQGLTIIGFVGSVFSPYYARARRQAPDGAADPLDHCAINVALYGDTAATRCWAMTERGKTRVQREPRSLTVGPSRMHWDGSAFVVEIDERALPFGSRLRGTVRVRPDGLARRSFALDAGGRHRWWPIAPGAVVEVDFDRPAMHWIGTGYLDANTGERPLEADFRRWNWSRARLADGESAVLYDVQRRDGTSAPLALRFDAGCGVHAFGPPPEAALPRSAWQLERGTRCDNGSLPRVRRRLEDGPFYARSLVESSLLGQRAVAMHESLSLDRFAAPWCQWMLPFRMPRKP